MACAWRHQAITSDNGDCLQMGPLRVILKYWNQNTNYFYHEGTYEHVVCKMSVFFVQNANYRRISNIRRTLMRNLIVDHLDVVGASPVGAAPTASSFST